MIDEIQTTRNLLRSYAPKQIYKGTGYVLKAGTKKTTNLEILDKILQKLKKIGATYNMRFNGEMLEIVTQNKFYAVKVYGG